MEMLNSKNKIMEQLTELSGKYIENETELELKNNEIKYLQKYNSELSDTNSKIYCNWIIK